MVALIRVLSFYFPPIKYLLINILLIDINLGAKYAEQRRNGRRLKNGKTNEGVRGIYYIIQQKVKVNQAKSHEVEKSRKKAVDDHPLPKKVEIMAEEVRPVKRMRFQDLPEDVELYLIEIYSFGNKLFLTGVMPNGQTLSIVANELYK